MENNNPDLSEVCPWTLFLTMSLTLLKGLMPHVPQMLPFLITDPEMRSRAEETFLDPEFQENIEEYFVNNIKTDVQAPLNRQIIKSSETIIHRQAHEQLLRLLHGRRRSGSSG